MRDNVLFEYGLFSGAIGRSKCALLVPDEPEFRIPSDLPRCRLLLPYTTATAQETAAALAITLDDTLKTPLYPETMQSKSRRILCFISWIRDEVLRLVEETSGSSNRSKHLIVSRVWAVSAFVQRDIDELQLRTECDRVRDLIIHAVERCPSAPEFVRRVVCANRSSEISQGRPSPALRNVPRYWGWNLRLAVAFHATVTSVTPGPGAETAASPGSRISSGARMCCLQKLGVLPTPRRGTALPVARGCPGAALKHGHWESPKLQRPSSISFSASMYLVDLKPWAASTLPGTE